MSNNDINFMFLSKSEQEVWVYSCLSGYELPIEKDGCFKIERHTRAFCALLKKELIEVTTPDNPFSTHVEGYNVVPTQKGYELWWEYSRNIDSFAYMSSVELRCQEANLELHIRRILRTCKIDIEGIQVFLNEFEALVKQFPTLMHFPKEVVWKILSNTKFLSQ